MAAPTTAALLAERLYALGVEVGELQNSCYAPPPCTAAQKAYFEQAYQAIKRFRRDAYLANDHGRGIDAGGPIASAEYAARSATEKSAYIVSEFSTTMTSTAAANVINAALTGQNQTATVATINKALAEGPNAATIGDVALG